MLEVEVGNAEVSFVFVDDVFKIEFFLCNYNNETINIQKDEVDNIFWLPMDEVFELIRQGKTKFPYNEQMEEIFQKVNRSQNIGKERE